MQKKQSISESEMKVMKKIWESGRMISVSEIVAELKQDGEEWNHTTISTFLTRLEDKKIISSTKSKNRRIYFPLVSREEYNRNEAENFISRFGGTLKDFLSAFSNSRPLNEKDIQELKEWLEKFDD
mgnify:CR=1 FL=1